MKLSGNTILVTGGSAGIGLAFTKKFKALGNEVIITGRRQAKLDEAAKEVPGIHTIQCDASDLEQVKAMAAEVAEMSGFRLFEGGLFRLFEGRVRSGLLCGQKGKSGSGNSGSCSVSWSGAFSR